MLTDQIFDTELQEYFKHKKSVKLKDIIFIKSKLNLDHFKLSDNDIKYHIKFNIPFCEHRCPVCDKPIHVDAKCLRFPCACSARCRSILSKQKRKDTVENRYGSSNPMQCSEIKLKQQQSVFDHYGVYVPAKSEYIVQKIANTKSDRAYKKVHRNLSESTKQKIKNTLLNEYGVDCIFKYEMFRKYTKRLNLEKYGKEYFTQTSQFKDKYKKTCIERYGEDHFFKTKEGKEIISLKNKNRPKDPCFSKRMKKYATKRSSTKKKNTYQRILKQSKNNLIIPLFSSEEYKGDKYNTKYKWQCLKCSNIFEHYYANGKIPKCPNCSRSLHEKENQLFEYVRSLTNLSILRNTRSIINPYELDIYIPDLKLAFEFNGNYWHSSICRKDKNYHLNKTKLCEEKGIRLIHIFEYDWDKNKDYVKSRIKRIFNNKETILDKYNIIKDSYVYVSRAWQSKVNNIFLKNAEFKLIKETPPNILKVNISKSKKVKIYDCGDLVFKKVLDTY